MNTIDSRVNRLIGQIEGIRRMIKAGRSCEEITQQILAAREALSKIGLLVLKEGICDTPVRNKNRTEKLLEKVFRI